MFYGDVLTFYGFVCVFKLLLMITGPLGCLCDAEKEE